jgi:hypothetical protein
VRFVGLIAGLAGCGEDMPPPPPPPNFGAAVVTWTIEDMDGTPIACRDLSLTRFSVAVGPSKVEVACGDDQRATFERLLPGTYGVTIALITGGGTLRTERSNVVVEAGLVGEVAVPIVVDREDLTQGRLSLDWIVAGGPALTECDLVGAATVRFRTTISSIGQFEREPSCEDGELMVEALDPGVYELEAELLAASGDRIGALQRHEILIRSGETTELTLFFATIVGDPAAFEGSWTITGSAAVDACGLVGADDVRVSIQTAMMGMPGVEIATATTACAAGTIRMDDLPPGATQVRAVFVLVSDLVGTLDSKSFGPFFLVEAETSTGSVDFDAP